MLTARKLSGTRVNYTAQVVAGALTGCDEPDEREHDERALHVDRHSIERALSRLIVCFFVSNVRIPTTAQSTGEKIPQQTGTKQGN